jgi:hypothetical protein
MPTTRTPKPARAHRRPLPLPTPAADAPPTTAAPPLPGRAVLRTRLRAAWALLNSRTPLAAGRLVDVLRDALDRARAAELVAALHTDPDEPDAARRTVLSARPAEPKTEWLLIPFGEVRVEHPVAGRSFHFTQAQAAQLVEWFARLGRKLAIDYEHQSLDRLNTRADGLRPAAGWIGRLEVRDDGLWAVDVSWTERAEALLRNGEYRYFSPVIYWSDAECRTIAGLGPVALTNDPAMHGVAPLTATRATPPADTPDADDEDTAAERLTRDAAALARAELDTLHAELGRLRQQLADQAADTFIARGLRLGKITPATTADWRADYTRAPQEAEARLSRAPVLLPPGRMLACDARGQVTPLDGPPVSDALRRHGIEPADLAAYERAVLAGRVRDGAAR